MTNAPSTVNICECEKFCARWCATYYGPEERSEFYLPHIPKSIDSKAGTCKTLLRGYSMKKTIVGAVNDVEIEVTYE